MGTDRSRRRGMGKGRNRASVLTEDQDSRPTFTGSIKLCGTVPDWSGHSPWGDDPHRTFLVASPG